MAEIDELDELEEVIRQLEEVIKTPFDHLKPVIDLVHVFPGCQFKLTAMDDEFYIDVHRVTQGGVMLGDCLVRLRHDELLPRLEAQLDLLIAAERLALEGVCGRHRMTVEKTELNR